MPKPFNVSCPERVTVEPRRFEPRFTATPNGVNGASSNTSELANEVGGEELPTEYDVRMPVASGSEDAGWEANMTRAHAAQTRSRLRVDGVSGIVSARIRTNRGVR
jgi:hypothetical protein